MIISDDVSGAHQTPKAVTKSDLFMGFLKCGLLGFGGVAPWARHIIVEERGWLSEREYAAVLGVGQALPGANTVNAAVMIGDRFQGVTGAVVCLVGLLAVPLCILIGVAQVYASFAGQPAVEAAVSGAAAAAAGLVIGTAAKMVRNLALPPVSLALACGACVSIGLLGWPLVPVLCALVPLGVIAAIRDARR